MDGMLLSPPRGGERDEGSEQSATLQPHRISGPLGTGCFLPDAAYVSIKAFTLAFTPPLGAGRDRGESAPAGPASCGSFGRFPPNVFPHLIFNMAPRGKDGDVVASLHPNEGTCPSSDTEGEKGTFNSKAFLC